MALRQGFPVEGDTGLDEALAFAAEHGFDFVELNMEGDFARSRVDPERVGERANAHGVGLAVHLPFSLDTGSPHEEVRRGAVRELEASIDAAAAMGAELGVYHATTHTRPFHWPAETVVNAMADTVRRLDEYAPDGFAPVVENVKGPFFDAGDFGTLLARTDAALCLDTGHALVSGYGADWQADFLREHGDRVAHVHFNDTRVERERDEHLPVGVGDFDFGALADAMRETDWTGTCTHEVFTADLGPLPASKANWEALRSE